MPEKSSTVATRLHSGGAAGDPTATPPTFLAKKKPIDLKVAVGNGKIKEELQVLGVEYSGDFSHASPLAFEDASAMV